jgi:hypothetical protein
VCAVFEQLWCNLSQDVFPSVPLEPTSFEAWMQEYSKAVRPCGIAQTAVLVQLLPAKIDACSKVIPRQCSLEAFNGRG